MAGNFEYYAELGLNAGAAISELSRVSSTAQTVSKNLEAMGKALDQVSKQGLKSGPEAKQLSDTLGLYQQLASAVSSYGRSLKTINSTDLNNGVRKTNTSLQHMEKALRGVSGTDKEVYDSKKRTLDLYKQMTSATKAQADTLKAEADAIKAVAQAERERQATAAAAAARPSGTDAWGVTKEERDLRKQYQTVLQAEKEMEAEFERRAREHLKASGLYARGEEPIRKVTEATNEMRAATIANAAAQEEQERALASSRYALYEIAAAYTAVSAAAFALPVASTRTAIEMEAQFAHVERTTQAAAAPLENLRQQFLDISTEIPVAFEELSKIGTLGAQMGIAEQDLASFSDTVAKFSATTNVTVDQAAMSFGRLANMMQLTEEDYVHLGSSISELGTASVATESEILAIAESIATTANMAGFTADQVVGLSTAMASLRVRPEMARGAMQRIFAKINKAAADGGESLAAFAQQVGLTNDQFVSMWRNDPSALFMRLTESIQGLDKVAATSTMSELGFTNTRDVELLNRLANGYKVYAESMALAQDAYARGDYLETETGPIFETTAAHLERLANAFKAMLDSFGGSALDPIKVVAEVLINLFNTIRDMPQGLKTLATTIGIVVGSIAALRAAFAASAASMLAFRLVQQQIGKESVLTLSGLLAQAGRTFPGLATYITAATAALNRFAVATGHASAGMTGAITKASLFSRAMSFMPLAGWVGLAATVVGAVASITNAFSDASEEMERNAQVMSSAMGGSGSIMEALRRDLAELASGDQRNPLAVVEDGVYKVGHAAEATQAIIDEYTEQQRRMGEQFDETTVAIDSQRFAIGRHTQELINKGIAESVALQEANQEALNRLLKRGFNVRELQQAYMKNGEEGARAYAAGFQQAINAPDSWKWDILGLGSPFYSQEVLEETRLLEEMIDPINGITGALMGAINQGEIFAQLGLVDDSDIESMEDLKGSTEGAADALDELVSAMFAVVDAEAAVFAAMDRLGQSMAENGNTFDTMTEAGRSNLEAFKAVVSAIANDIKAQMDAGAIEASDAAVLFAQQYEALILQLESMGVDTSQFDRFRDHLDTLFETPIGVDLDTAAAIAALDHLQAYAQSVFDNLSQQGLDSGWAASGARYSAQAAAQGVGPESAMMRHQRNMARTRERQRQNAARRFAEERAARLQAIEASRAAAEQERLAREAERAKNETKKQADEQKRAADEAKKLRQEIADAKDEGRIFEEIMKGLSSAFKDTLHNFNNFQTARDSVEQQLINMRNAAQESADKVRELREEHRKLRQEASEDRADARQADIFAAVARRYGDDTRYEEYRNEAKNARASAKEKERLAREALNEANAIEKNRLALTGYSEQAIKNRGDVRALQERMADLILAYAETGATTQEVTAYAEQLRRKFIDQMVQMGYNRQDAERLSRVFQTLKTDIDRIPRQVRIEAQARVKEAEAALRNVARGRTAKIDFVPGNKEVKFTAGVTTPSLDVTRQVKAPTLDLRGYGNGITSNWVRSGGGLIPGPSHGPAHRDDKIVIGRNGPEGMVRSGEFVIRKPAVDAIGLNALHALNSMSPGAAVMSSAPAVNASRGVQLVELLPHQVHQLAQAVSTVLAVDGKVLAGTTNAQNTNAARRGVR